MMKMTQTFVSLRCKARLPTRYTAFSAWASDNICVINRRTMLSVRSSSGGWMWWCIIILEQQLYAAIVRHVACICCHEMLSVWQTFCHEMLSIWQTFCHEYDGCLLTVYLHSCYFIWFVHPPCFLYDHQPFSVLSLGIVLPVIVYRCCLCDCPVVLSVWSSNDAVYVTIQWCLCDRPVTVCLWLANTVASVIVQWCCLCHRPSMLSVSSSMGVVCDIVHRCFCISVHWCYLCKCPLMLSV